jgi:hypothetical protein
VDGVDNGGVIAVIMLAFMWSMFDGTRTKAVILVASVLVASGSLWLVRSQATVGDVSYMKAMITHHSIAIMTSERAKIRDPRVRKLADEIIKAQVREIDEMKRMIAELKAAPPASTRRYCLTLARRPPTDGGSLLVLG